MSHDGAENMSSTGLEERAAGLAVLLSPLGLRQAAPSEQGGVAADLGWAATYVLSDLLSASRKEGALSRDGADALLRGVGYELATFETRGWLRWILGCFHIPRGVGIAIAGMEANRVPEGIAEAELRALAPIRTRVYSHADSKPMLSRTDAESILIRHEGAPTLADLARDGSVQIIGDDVALETRASTWSSLGDRIAATLWMRGPDANDFARWMKRVPSAWWIRAPEHLAVDHRARLLDAMVEAIEAEEDLKHWTDEVSHIAPDVGDLGREVRRIPPPVSTQLARYSWWKHRRVEGGRCRGRLACLVAGVVRNDASHGPHPFSRIRKLLSLAAEKAWLALVVPSNVLHGRPEALASLSVDSQNSVLAMSLLDSLSIPETSWDTADESERRRERYRTSIWRELLSLFVAGLSSRGETDTTAADACIELLAYLERRSTQGGFLMDPARRAIHDAEVRTRLSAFGDELANATLAHKVNGERARYLPRALSAIATSLKRTVSAEPDQARRLALLFWLFDRAVDEVDKPLAASIAVDIADEFAGWLNRDLDNGALDAWFDEELQVADLPWQRVLLASSDATNRIVDGIDLYGKDIAAVHRSITRKSDVVEGDDGSFEEYQLNSTLLRKRRLYLWVLLRSLERLPSSSRVIAQPPASLEKRLQQRLCRVLGNDAAEGANVFSGTPYLSANSELAALTLRAAEELPNELRQKCLADWILKEDDPFLVLGILSETRSNSLRVVAEGRFALIDWEAYFGEQTFWPTMFALARLAIGANKLELAETILKKDASPSPRDEQSFVPRLMLAAARGDEVDSVTLPREGDRRDRDVVAFFRGLRELSIQPADAVRTYEALVRRCAYLAESAVNLFSARLRLAGAMTNGTDRMAAIASALGEWKQTAAKIAAEDRRRVAWDAHQNELYALHQLGLEADFWRLWKDLPIEELASEPFVRLALVAAASQDKDAGQRVLGRALEFHGEPMPEWLSTLQAETSAGKIQPLLPPRTAQLSDDDIRAAYNEGLRRPITSRAVIFSSVADADLDNFLLDLHLNAARELQRLEVALGQLSEEDKLSDFMIAFLRSACRAMAITIHSQERGGLSGGDGRTTDRGGVGERDWTVQADAIEIAIVEALQLPSASGVIQHHLRKLLERYDRAGLPRAFMLLYVRDLDFDGNAGTYQAAVRAWATTEAPLIGDVEVHASPAAFLRILRTAHRRGDSAETIVFHLLVRIPRQARQVART